MVIIKTNENINEIWFAGGCFWGVEKFFKNINGVLKTQVGYANAKVKNPAYEEVCSGNTEAAEAVYIVFDNTKLHFKTLLNAFFKVIDPTSINKQGGDTGSQYRSGIYYKNEAYKDIAEKYIVGIQKEYDKAIVVEVLNLENFYPAEEYHQEYLDKNPGGYCHISPAMFDYAKNIKKYTKPTDEELIEKLNILQYNVTQNNATEKPFENEYDQNFNKGIYVDITTGEPLFASSDKYDAGCGWPSFSKPIEKNIIEEKIDTSIADRVRTEVRSKAGDSHLGHVFNDGEKELGGLRYCINSASLKFVSIDDMDKEGYSEYKKYVK